MKVNEVVEPCCSEQDIEIVNGINTCVNCGLVDGYVFVHEYFDFYDNMNKILRKSIYHRDYHIENVLYSISSEKNIHLTYHQRDKIHKVFVEIDVVFHKVNDGRKRITY